MNKFDAADILLIFVQGLCWQYEVWAKQFTGRPDEFDAFTRRTYEKVWAHVHNNATLGANYSDHEIGCCERSRKLWATLNVVND